MIVGRDLVLGVVFAGRAAPRAATPRHRCTTSARPRRSACSTRSRCCCSARTTARCPTSPARSPGRSRIWGTGLYLWAGAVYLRADRRARARRPRARHDRRRGGVTRRSCSSTWSSTRAIPVTRRRRSAHGGHAAQHWYDEPARRRRLRWSSGSCSRSPGCTPIAARRRRPRCTTSWSARVRAAENDATTTSPRTEAALTTELNKLRAAGAAGELRARPQHLSASQLHRRRQPRCTGPGSRCPWPSRRSTASRPTAPGAAAGAPSTTAHILIDRDVRSVVNQLWADGAEAISVNGIRLTPTSADPLRRRRRARRLPADRLAVRDRRDRQRRPAGHRLRSRATSPAATRRWPAREGIGFSSSRRPSCRLPGSPDVTALRYADGRAR